MTRVGSHGFSRTRRPRAACDEPALALVAIDEPDAG